MARRGKKRRGGSRSKKLPLAIMVPLAANGIVVGKYLMAGNTADAMAHMSGFDPADGKFKPGVLVTTYGPVLAGVMIHKAAGRLGVNRYIPKWLPVSI